MFLQLGNQIYKGLYTPEEWNVSGDEAVYAEHALINSKPRLQNTGSTLQEQNFTLKLRPEWCIPQTALDSLKTSKSNAEVLSLLQGNGVYIGDFVIVSMPYTIDTAFADGSAMEVTVNITLKEFVAFSKLEMQQQAARVSAFAIGTKKTVVARPPQSLNDFQTLSTQLTQSNEQINKINGLVSDYQNNASKREKLASDIKSAVTKAKTSLNNAQATVNQVQKIQDKATGLVGAAEQTKSMLDNIVSIMPPTSLSDLQNANTSLQSAVNSMNTASTNALIPVAIRRNDNSK
jgi:phage protein U